MPHPRSASLVLLALLAGWLGTVLAFNRREEPKLLMDPETGMPLALFNVVDSSFSYNDSHIIVQELDYG